MTGFGSFAEEETVDLTQGVLYIFGENLDQPGYANSNGAGKTTVLDAISWSIYGLTPAGSGGDSIINRFRDEVETFLWMDGLVIHRSKKKSHAEKVRWHTGDGIWQQKDLKYSQQVITDTFGISFACFTNTLYLTSKSATTRFIEATPGERGKVLSELVDDEVFRMAGDLVLEDLKKAEDVKERAVVILQELRLREEDMVVAHEKLQAQLTDFTFQDKNRRSRVTKQIERMKDEAKKAQDLLNNPPEMTMSEVQEQKQTFKAELRKNLDRIASLTHLIDSIDTSLGEGSMCPTCQRELNEEEAVDLHELVEEAMDEVEHIKESNISLEDVIQELDEDQEYLRTYRAEAQMARDVLERIQGEIALLRDELQPSDASHLRLMIEENKQNLEDLRVRKEELEQKIHKASEEIPYLKALRKGFSVEVRNLMFDRLRGALEYYSNHYARMLAGNEFTLEFPPQSSTGREKFEIILRSGTHQQKLERYSGGETWRATFSVLLALRRILLEGNHCAAQWLLVDDPVGDLDEVGTQAFASVMQTLTTNGEDGISQVVVTLPRTIQELDGETLTVVRKNRISKIA